jgi:hypothetical protein
LGLCSGGRVSRAVVADMNPPAQVLFGQEAKDEFEQFVFELNEHRAKQMRISTAQALESSRLMADIYRMFWTAPQ